MSHSLNIRQKINLAGRAPELVALEQLGIVSENGNITALGRRIQADLIFQGKTGSMEDVVEAVRSAYAAEAAADAVFNGEDDEPTEE